MIDKNLHICYMNSPSSIQIWIQHICRHYLRFSLCICTLLAYIKYCCCFCCTHLLLPFISTSTTCSSSSSSLPIIIIMKQSLLFLPPPTRACECIQMNISLARPLGAEHVNFFVWLASSSAPTHIIIFNVILYMGEWITHAHARMFA